MYFACFKISLYKKKFHYTIKHSLYINSKKYIFKKNPEKKQEFEQEFKKKPDKCITIYLDMAYIFVYYASFSLHT